MSWAFQPLLPGAAQQLSGGAGPGDAGYVNVWMGSAWVRKPVKVWTGTSWEIKPLKYWSGTAWVDS